jgi:hypothetical protein
MKRCVLVVLGWLCACSWSTGGSGDTCTRSTECNGGLACIEGACSDDLSALEDPGSVPVLVRDAATGDDALDASGDAASGAVDDDAS